MTTFSVLPGTLNVNVRQGDALSFVVDFDIGLTGYTVTSHVYSLVDGATVQALTTSVLSASEGRVQCSLDSETTAGLADGTYKWQLRWDTGSESYRTAVEGVFEVRP